MAQLDSNIVLKAFATPQLDIVGTMRDAEDRRRQDAAYAQQQRAQAQAAQDQAAERGVIQQYGTDPMAARNSAFQTGNAGLVAKLDSMDDAGRKRTIDIARSTAPLVMSLAKVPAEQTPQAMQALAPELQARGWSPEHIAEVAQQLSDPAQRDAAFAQIMSSAQTIEEYAASRKPVLVGEGQQMRLPDGTLIAEGAPKFHAVTTPAGGTTTIFGAPGGQGAPSSPIGPQIESTVSSFVPGVTVTSRQRSAAHNAEVGGVSDSYHISDNARDFVPPKGMSMSALASAVRAKMLGFDVINEGDHVHVEPSPGMGRRTGGTLTIKGQPKPVSAIPGGPDGEGAKALAGRGYRYKPDGTLEPIPGGPADLGDIEIPPPKEIAKRNAAYPKVAGSYRAATFDIDAQIKDLEKLKTHPGLDNIVGAFDGRLPAVLPNSAAASALLKKILARGQFRALQDMRNNSPTGGALGNVSDSENKTLRQSVAALDQTQDETAFRAAIDQYIDDLRHTKNNLTQTFEDTYAYRKQSSAPASSNGWGKAQVVR